MLQLVLNRLLRVVTVLLGVTLIAFLLIHAIPGDPWSNYANSPRINVTFQSDKILINQLQRRFGLDQPLWRQFTRYTIGGLNDDGTFTCGAICGNLGPSIRQRGRPIQDVLFEHPEGLEPWKSRFGYSIRLVFFAALLAAGLGIALGIVSAARANSWLSRSISVGLAGLISVPSFVLGLLAMIVLGTRLKLISVLPDWNQPSNWIVPATVLALMPMAGIARVTRASLLNILHEDYVRTAHAKGLTPARVMQVHVLRNALVPVITFLGPAVMEMFTGLLIIENLYGFPGVGREFWEAVLALDYPMIMALTLLYAGGLLVVNLVTEIVCEILDPRLRSVKGPADL